MPIEFIPNFASLAMLCLIYMELLKASRGVWKLYYQRVLTSNGSHTPYAPEKK